MHSLNKLGSRKGFTLIEMLIVIAIIGILASIVLVGLGPVQRRGRDARRQSDLRSTQSALELYFNKCGYYPGPAAPGACAGYSANNTWSGMSAALTGSGIGITQIPNDPSSAGGSVTARNYEYATDGTGTTYVLKATLEDTTNPALNDSLKTPPPGVTITCSGSGQYCISL